jgi:hypothetical protein
MPGRLALVNKRWHGEASKNGLICALEPRRYDNERARNSIKRYWYKRLKYSEMSWGNWDSSRLAIKLLCRLHLVWNRLCLRLQKLDVFRAFFNYITTGAFTPVGPLLAPVVKHDFQMNWALLITSKRLTLLKMLHLPAFSYPLTFSTLIPSYKSRRGRC